MGHQFLTRISAPQCLQPHGNLLRKLIVLRGANLVALTADTATIETLTGCRQTYRSQPVEVGRVVRFHWVVDTVVPCGVPHDFRTNVKLIGACLALL